MKRIFLLFSILLLVNLNDLLSQTPTIPPIPQEPNLFNINFWVNLAAGIVGAGGLIFWFWKMKLPDIIEKEVEKKIGEKAGVKAELVRTYFKRLESEENLKNASILVINKSVGLRDSLRIFLEKKGYKNLKFKTLDQVNQGFEAQDFKMIVFDNEDTLLEESEIKSIMDRYATAYGSKFVCYTKKSLDMYRDAQYNTRIKIIQDIINLDDNILFVLS
jgi:hypothetical protein